MLALGLLFAFGFYGFTGLFFGVAVRDGGRGAVKDALFAGLLWPVWLAVTPVVRGRS